ncbi:MAG: hypothetical protein M3411_01080 [Chloroflexota bacterium]|nr:hypothetical protein [Chloroflexota bacterium]
MAGSLVDLSVAGSPLPSQRVIDSSIVVEWLAATFRSRSVTLPTPTQIGVARMVRQMQVERVVGLVTSTSLNEVFHYVLKTSYRLALPNHRDDLLARYPNVRRHSWEHLFKARSDLVAQVAADLDRVRRLMVTANLLVLEPGDLGPIPSGRTLDDELVRTMARFALDSNDAAILIEARRAGISAVASSDPDLRRAQLDFDVYTWL